jgi:ribose 5-phosphate isomerase A
VVHLLKQPQQPSIQASPIYFLPTSYQSRQLLIESHLPLSDCSQYTDIEVTIDGADEVDQQLNCIKGGGGCHLQEKLVASLSRTLVLIADDRKISQKLGQQWTKGVPLEVVPIASESVLRRLMDPQSDFGCQKAAVRTGTGKAGPVITDNGNFIIDAHFGPISDVAGLDTRLQRIVGVVETGLFVGMAKFAYFGSSDGSVKGMTPR